MQKAPWLFSPAMPFNVGVNAKFWSENENLAEIGDYSPEEHGEDYLKNYVFSSDQPENFAEQVTQLHRMHK